MRKNFSLYHGGKSSQAQAKGVLSLEHLLPGNFLNVGDVGLGDAEFCEQRLGQLGPSLGCSESQGRAALHSGAMEEAFSGWHGEHGRSLRAPTGLTEDHHLTGITAESFNVVPDPFQRRHQIHHSRDACCGELRRRGRWIWWRL